MQLIFIIAYFIVLISIGIYSRKRSKTVVGFFVAERRLGLLSLSFTISATVIGGTATIIAGMYIFQYGLAGLWLALSAGLGLIILALLFARKIRALELYTLPQIIERMYSQKVRIIASVVVIIAEIAWLALIIQSTQAILSTFLPLAPKAILFIVTGIFILYTYLGGQYAVAYSDIIQFSIMIIGICFIAAPLAYYYSGGFSSLPQEFLSFPTSSSFGVIDLFSLLLMVGLSHMVGSDIYGKVLSAKTKRTASTGVLLAGCFRIVFGIAIVIIALSALKIIPHLEKPESLIPEMIFRAVPFPLDALVVVALLATLMSSADSVLLTASTIFSNDVVQLKDEKSLLRLCKIMVIVIGAFSLVLAIYSPELIETFRLGYSIFAAGIVMPVLFGFYKDKLRINTAGAFASMVGGGSIVLICHFCNWEYPIRILQYPVLCGMAVSTLMLFLVSFLWHWLFPKKSR